MDKYNQIYNGFFRFSVEFTIVKGTSRDQDQAQNGVWLEPLLEQIDNTGIQIKFFKLKHPFLLLYGFIYLPTALTSVSR